MPNDGKPRDQIGYEALQQEALRGVVRAALKRIASKGVPGDHHFFITFKTGAAGVTGPKDLLTQYPDEMMIVLQHQFWDLAPGETFFSVTLRFGGQPKSLSVPYAAITQFWDPSVDYRLRFSPPETAPASRTAPHGASQHAPQAAPALPAKSEGPIRRPLKSASEKPASEKPAAEKQPSADAPNIVSLDQFRKK
jgi:hypothetical protein